MEPTPESILAFALSRAQETWAVKRQPYPLSRLSPDLLREGVEYKTVLGEQRLKDFLRTAPEQVKIVIHPTQKSKVGIIPADQDFEYEPAEILTSPPPPIRPASVDKIKCSWRAYIVSNFLQLISELDETEAQQVQIPLPVLAKLMRKK